MISTKILYSAVFKTGQDNDLHKIQSPPRPSGNYPYRLDLTAVLNSFSNKMVFHMVGDTGFTSAELQQQVAVHMTRQCHSQNPKQDLPAFLYHLGDIVYHYGEAEQYEDQFLKPFENYPAPVYAIAGNHDTDVNPDNGINYESLDAFYTAFCNTCPATMYFGTKSNRKSQVQPHVYWTMETPLVSIIGLHTNVPKYGYITKEQKNWFIKELQNAVLNHPEKATIVCMHHAPYSADVNHGSSKPMIQFLEAAFEEAQVKPDAVFSGHVHNYQRFIKTYDDGKNLPFIVAGAGGFDELHPLTEPDNHNYTNDSKLLEQVCLVKHCDNRHGFLKITVEKTPFKFTIQGEYYTVAASEEASLFDQFTIDLTGR